MMCGRASDLIGTAVPAVGRGMTAKELSDVTMPHPTYCEGIREAARALL